MKHARTQDGYNDAEAKDNRDDDIQHGNGRIEVSFELLFSQFRFPEFPFWIIWWRYIRLHHFFPFTNASHCRDS